MFWVWRGGGQAGNDLVPQAAQSFTATLPYLDSASVNIGPTDNGLVTINVWKDPGQTDPVPGGSRTVAVNPFGETTATFSPALALSVGQTYYLQVIHTPGDSGQFLVYHSLWDDYASGQSQLNWGAWSNT